MDLQKTTVFGQLCCRPSTASASHSKSRSTVIQLRLMTSRLTFWRSGGSDVLSTRRCRLMTTSFVDVFIHRCWQRHTHCISEDTAQTRRTLVCRTEVGAPNNTSSTVRQKRREKKYEVKLCSVQMMWCTGQCHSPLWETMYFIEGQETDPLTIFLRHRRPPLP